MPNVKEIVKKYLDENGFDGLFSEDTNCACRKDALFLYEPCPGECRPGYNAVLPPNAAKRFWIVEKKPE